MVKKKSKFVRNACLALVAGLALSASLSATVLMLVHVKCPVCGEPNDFYSFSGWGGYLYYYPSKFQMVFFPHSYPTALWSCKRCHYTAWAWDFDKLPNDKIEAVRKTVSDGPALPGFKNYAEVPMAARLAVAERVYRSLETGDFFWSQFYRVKGYHLGLCGKSEEARQARLISRALLTRLAIDPKNLGQEKELLLTLAAMDHYTGNDAAALEILDKAGKKPAPAGEDSKEHDRYLNDLIAEYAGKIRSKSVPGEEESVNTLPAITGVSGSPWPESPGEGISEGKIWTVRVCEK